MKEKENINLLNTIFRYFKEVSNDEDAHLTNVFSILRTAQKYMGPKTMELQTEADRDLGRRV